MTRLQATKALNELLILSPVVIFFDKLFVLMKTPKPAPSSEGSLFRRYYVEERI